MLSQLGSRLVSQSVLKAMPWMAVILTLPLNSRKLWLFCVGPFSHCHIANKKANLNLSLTDVKSTRGLSAVFSELSGDGWGHLCLCLFSAKVALGPVHVGWVCVG